MKFFVVLIFFLSMSCQVFAKEGKTFPTYKVGGQLVVDGAWFFEKDFVDDDQEIRRARVYLKGDLQKDISYEMEYDFSSKNGYKDLYLKYSALEFGTTLKVGNIKEPIGLSALTSSKYNTFMERALPNIFIFDRKVGMTLSKSEYVKKRYAWGVTAGGFLKPLEDISQDNNEYSFSIRARYASFFKKKSLWHIGASTAYTSFDDKKYKLSVRPESHLSKIKYLKTKIKHTDKIIRYAFETIYQNGSFTAQAEYIKEYIETTTSKEYDFYGWYAEVSYFFGNESKRYKPKEGVYGRIKLKNSLSKKSLGAIEGALRISYVDLNDQDKEGGEVYQYGVGLNWYILNNLRVMLNHITIDRKNDTTSYDPKILQLRIQYDF